MELSRRRLLGGLGAFGGALAVPRRAAARTPPPEAYQPAATKNWWYFNGHLYDPGDPADPRYDYMARS
jgi:hypothetical protein